MNIEDCNLLITVWEERSLTRAAQRLFISQPSVTYKIKQLEKYYKVKVFTKHNKGIRFTAEGEMLVNHAQKLIEEHTLIKNKLLNMGDELQGTLRIGVALNFAHYKLPIILKKFCDIYPKVKINLETALSPKVMELLQQDLIDIGIESGGYKWEGEKILLSSEKISVISKDEIILQELPNLPMIKNKTNPNLKNLIDYWWKDHFTSPPIVMMEVDHITTCKEMVKKGLGYGIVPSDCLTATDSLHIIELTRNGEPLQRDNWLNYRKSQEPIPVVDEFVKFILNEEL